MACYSWELNILVSEWSFFIQKFAAARFPTLAADFDRVVDGPIGYLLRNFQAQLLPVFGHSYRHWLIHLAHLDLWRVPFHRRRDFLGPHSMIFLFIYCKRASQTGRRGQSGARPMNPRDPPSPTLTLVSSLSFGLSIVIMVDDRFNFIFILFIFLCKVSFAFGVSNFSNVLVILRLFWGDGEVLVRFGRLIGEEMVISSWWFRLNNLKRFSSPFILSSSFYVWSIGRSYPFQWMRYRRLLVSGLILVSRISSTS